MSLLARCKLNPNVSAISLGKTTIHQSDVSSGTLCLMGKMDVRVVDDVGWVIGFTVSFPIIIITIYLSSCARSEMSCVVSKSRQ